MSTSNISYDAADDSWGQASPPLPSDSGLSGHAATSKISKTPPASKPPLRDSWDDSDEDEDEDDVPVDNAKLWKEANTRAPMPDVVLTSNSSNAPPPAALAGPMKILKRPTAATSPASSGLSNSSDASSLAQREARYKMARDRIFGSPNSSIPGTPSEGSQSDLASTNPPGRNSNNSTNIARNPRGPSSSGDTDVKSVSKGFINRQKK